MASPGAIAEAASPTTMICASTIARVLFPSDQSEPGWPAATHSYPQRSKTPNKRLGRVQLTAPQPVSRP